MHTVIPVLALVGFLLGGGFEAVHGHSSQVGQVGWASWYGPFHHGRPTASGERFSMYHLTAAHRTLPLGTIVRVTNLETRQQVVVRINDRGPYVEPGRRIIDLSRAAARRIGLEKPGLGRVRVATRLPTRLGRVAAQVFRPWSNPVIAVFGVRGRQQTHSCHHKCR